jgi:hypothetical protein
MTDEEIIGKEFEGVKFTNTPRINYDSSYKDLIGKIGIVDRLHSVYPDCCYVLFTPPIGKIEGRWYPTDLVKQQIIDRIPIDLDKLFNEIKSL